MENLIIEERHEKILQKNIFGVIMTVLSILVLLYGIKKDSFLFGLIGCIGVLFFSIHVIYSFSRLIKPKALLTITMDGIIDDSSVGSVGFISFADIDKFEIVNVFGQLCIGIWPLDAEQFIRKLPQLRQKPALSNLRMKLPPIAIRVDSAKDMLIEDILTLLQKRHSDYMGLYR